MVLFLLFECVLLRVWVEDENFVFKHKEHFVLQTESLQELAWHVEVLLVCDVEGLQVPHWEEAILRYCEYALRSHIAPNTHRDLVITTLNPQLHWVVLCVMMRLNDFTVFTNDNLIDGACSHSNNDTVKPEAQALYIALRSPDSFLCICNISPQIVNLKSLEWLNIWFLFSIKTPESNNTLHAARHH